MLGSSLGILVAEEKASTLFHTQQRSHIQLFPDKMVCCLVSRFIFSALFFQDTINALTNQNTILQAEGNRDNLNSSGSTDDENSRVSPAQNPSTSRPNGNATSLIKTWAQLCFPHQTRRVKQKETTSTLLCRYPLFSYPRTSLVPAHSLWNAQSDLLNHGAAPIIPWNRHMPSSNLSFFVLDVESFRS